MMNKKTVRMGWKAFTFSAALMASLGANAETIEVQKFKYAGPYPVATPVRV